MDTSDIVMMWDDINRFNEAVKDWGQDTRKLLLMKMVSMGLKERVKLRAETKRNIRRLGIGKAQGNAILQRVAGGVTLYESLGVKFRKKSEEIFFVSFPFARHGVFLAKGVSRGHKLSNPRGKKDFYTEVMNMRTEVLSGIVAEKYSDGIAKEVLNVVGVEIKR